jgi:hypothetical protein
MTFVCESKRVCSEGCFLHPVWALLINSGTTRMSLTMNASSIPIADEQCDEVRSDEPAHHPEILDDVEHDRFGGYLPPPEKFLRRTRRSEEGSSLNTRIESTNRSDCTTKRLVRLSIEDFILESLMDEQPVNCCLLRIVEVLTWERSGCLKNE